MRKPGIKSGRFDNLNYEPDWILPPRINHLIDTGKVKIYTWKQYKNLKKVKPGTL